MQFEIWIDGEEPVEMSAEALEMAWGESVPESLAKALSLDVGLVEKVNTEPEIFVRRLS